MKALELTDEIARPFRLLPTVEPIYSVGRKTVLLTMSFLMKISRLGVCPILAAMAGWADDEMLPSLLPSKPEPAIVQTLGGGPFCISEEVAFSRLSADATELFLAHLNEARISVLDARTGLPKMQIPIFGRGSDFSADGRMVSGIHESFENSKLKRPFGVWNWPERTARWVREDLGLPDFSRFSPDGKLLAISANIPGVHGGHRVLVLDASSGKEVWHKDIPLPVASFNMGLAWSGNDWVMAGFSKVDENRVRIFDAASGQDVDADSEVLKSTPLQPQITASLHTPLTVLHDELSFVVVRRTAENHLESVFIGGADSYTPDVSIRDVDISPDGKTLFVATATYCRIYDVEKRTLVHTLRDGANTAQFSADGETIIMSRHAAVILVATKTWERRLPASPPVHSHSIDQTLFSPDGKLLASSDGGKILIWDWAKGRIIARIPSPDPERDLRDMVFHPMDTLLIAGDGAGVYWWDYARAPANASGLLRDAGEPPHARISHLKNPPKPVRSHRLSFDRTGKYLANMTNGFANLVHLKSDVREVADRLERLSLGEFDRYDRIREVALSPDGRKISIATEHQLRSFKLDPLEVIGEWEIKGFGRDGKVSAFSPDGTLFAVNAKTHGTEIVILETESGAVKFSLSIASGEGLLNEKMTDWKAWSADGSLLVCSAYNQLQDWAGFYVWDMKTGRSLGSKRTSFGRIATITFSPDGRHLATAGANGSIQIWDFGKIFTP